MIKQILVILGLVVLLFGCAAPEETAAPEAVEEQLPAPVVTCSDSDAGIDLAIKGTVTIGTASYEDKCENQSHITEYYCDNDNLGTSVLACPAGSACDAGLCIQLPEPPPAKCQETDSGKDFPVAGTVTYEGTSYADLCQGNYDMVEYYCENDEMKQETRHCQAGEKCENGACISLDKTCSDSDSADQSLAGTTTLYGGGMVVLQKSDACLDDVLRTEYYCDGNELKNDTESCEQDTFCKNGACIPLCHDADSGMDYHTAAYVSSYEGRFDDYCSDNYTLAEYYCDGTSAAAQQHDCDSFCYNNRCLSASDVDCKESGGITKLVYGKIELEEYENTCLDYRILREYLCISDEVEYVNEQCDDEEICYQGDCIAIAGPACYDLDDYEEDDGIYVASMVIKTDNDSILQTKEDSCMDSRTVLEYMCDGNSFTTDFISCGTDEKCVDGECVYSYTCTETDGGISVEPGEASLSEEGSVVRTEKDGCTGSGDIWEVYCGEDRIEYTTIECPEGTSCNSETRLCE